MHNIPDFLRVTPEMQEHFAMGGDIYLNEYSKGGQHGGLDRWFAEKWVDVKTGKECGRQEGDDRRGYPACRPSKRINNKTPKTASELSSSEKERFRREKTSSQRISYQHRRKEDGGLIYPDELDSMKSGGWAQQAAIAISMKKEGKEPKHMSMGGKTFSAGGEKHRVYEKESPTGNGEGVKGHIMVTHPTMDKGKWDTIDLTEKSGARTVAEGVAATKQWHEENPEYGNGGYTVRRSHDRKGKTHVVIGPDGTKKYFGDPNMGERGKSKHGKEAFYARHAKNLKKNPYFRAYARATWEDGGEIPEFGPGGSYGPFYNRRDAAKLQRWRNPTADSMTPSFFAMGGLNKYQDAGRVMLSNTANTGQGINTTSPAWSPSISPVATTPNITTAGLDNQNQNQFTMDEKQITTKTPSDDTKMQPDVSKPQASSGSVIDTLNKFSGYSALGKGIEQLQNAGEQALGATNILSRGFANSQQNAILDFNRKQDNPTNYLNKVSNFAGIQYSKNGGTIGQYKEGDELELTPTQMYLLEKKGYKFQILNK